LAGAKEGGTGWGEIVKHNVVRAFRKLEGSAGIVKEVAPNLGIILHHGNKFLGRGRRVFKENINGAQGIIDEADHIEAKSYGAVRCKYVVDAAPFFAG
jgi:hypothetical protein